MKDGVVQNDRDGHLLLLLLLLLPLLLLLLLSYLGTFLRFVYISCHATNSVKG